MVLSLAEYCAQLQTQFAFKSQAAIPGCESVRGHKSLWFEHFKTLLQIGGALIQHAQLLKAHRHVIARNECDEFIARWRLQVDDLEDTLRLLQQHKCLLELIPQREVISGIGQLSQNNRDLALIDFDLLVVHGVERVLVLA